MKKILLLGFALIMSFYSIESNAQNIQSVTITSPISCYGDLANINIQINQSTPPVLYKVIVGYYPIPGLFVSVASTNNTTVTNINVPGLAAQNYTIRLVDSLSYYPTDAFGNPADPNSIIDVATINITQPLQLSNSASVSSSILCFGDCDATATVNVMGGTPPYSIAFGSGASTTISLFDSTYIDLCAGTYSISVTDANSCIVNISSPTSIIINEPPQLIPNGSITSDYNGEDISCFGIADGEITANVSGGTPPYTYSLDGITYGSTLVFSSLSAGTYTIYYKDDNGCDTSESVTLNNPPDLSGVVSISSQVSCFGVCDGELTFQVNNILTGTAPYTYSIGGGPFQNSPTFPNLCGNTTYSITVMDANGCIYNANKFLPEPTQISFTYSTSDYNGFNISCFGLSDGEIIFNAPSGGQPPYTYSIDGSNFNTTMNFTGLSVGTYPVTVQDANGCTEVISVILTEPAQFSINFQIDSLYGPTNTPISCPGVCDGAISVLPTNGIAPILYDMTGYPTQTSQSWNNMCGDITFGTYILNATDDNGCTASINITLTEPLPFLYTVDSTPEYCGDSNGTASISITQGGTLSYAYLWDDLSAQTTSVATNLITGMYVVRVTDANGCQFTEDVFVPEADITLTFDSIPPCSGGLGGQATANPNGVPPYSYNWTTTGETTQTITGLSPGYYTVIVTDINGCTVTDSVEIPASAIVNITLDASNSTLSVLCNGFQSDTITVIATGGTGIGTYQYYIPGVFPIPQYNNIFSGLYAGTYDVYAVDANGCSDLVSITIAEPDVIYYTATSLDVSCNSGSDGSAWVDSVSGGTPPYFYTWNTSQNTSIISNLTAGTYTVSVTDVNNCASNPQQVSVVVDEPTQLISTTTIINHSSCSGSQTAANGEAEVIVSGGNPGYSYSWSNGANGTNISLLFPGTYIVDIVDANGCMISDTAIINPGTNPILDVTVQDVSCYGANDGMMITNASSGTAPYQFSADGGNTFVPFGTPFGPSGEASYFITVVDAEGCNDSDSIFVNEPDELIISSLTVQNVLCYDSANGQITANVIGGTGSYSYIWNNGQITNPAVGLMPSIYFVDVTDSMGCSATSLNEQIIQPDSLYVDSITVTHVSCNGGNDGSAIATVSGGTQSYFYSWSGGSDVNLIAGTYTSTITDANGCITSENFTVTEPPAISIQFIRDSVNCIGGSDGMATAIISGGTGSHYLLWDDGSTTAMVNTFDAGFHTLTVTDDNGCVFMDSVEILEPSQSVEIDSLIISEITCNNANNASITVLATGGQLPYVYSNTNGVFTQNGIGFINLAPNQYIMYVRDVRGCVDRDTVDILQPDSLYIDTTIFTHITCNGANDGQINAVNAFGGTQPYLYSVNGGAYHANMAYFSGYGPGTYTVEVLDSNNCAAQDIIIIEEPDELDVTITTSNWNGYEVQCNGDNSGYANISINGGNGPYLKTVYNAASNVIYNGNSPTINNLSAGMYTFVVTDNNGCTYSESLLYQEPTAITHSFVIDHISCTGWTNGSITDIVSGGVGSATTYSYLWNTGDTTYSLNNVGAGNYTITVTDENNCSISATAVVNGNSALTSSIGNTENPTCWNYCDGEIEVIPSGGVPNINGSGNTMYNYQWDDQLLQITQTAIGLCVDDPTNSQTFTCIITDALGCTTTETFTLTQPEKLEISIWQTGEVQCFGGDEGSLSVSTTGGNAGTITYTWNTGQSNPSTSINNLVAGTYVVVATDPIGCMDTTDYTITEPSSIEASISNLDITDVLCHGDTTGEISVTTTGGTTNVVTQYSYVWSPNNIGTSSESFDFVTQTGTGTLSDIDTGLYQVTVTDVNGCTTESNIVYVAQPTNPLSIFMDSTDQSCITEGTATAYVLGGTPTYNYLWSPGGQSTATATALTPNTTYSVLVTDANGCTISDQTYINGYRNIFLPNNDDEIDSTICLGSEIDILVEDQGYEYLWSTGETTASITVIPQDFITIYTLSITDPNCPAPYEVEAIFNVIQLDINPVATPNPLVLGDMVTIESSYSYNDFVWTWDSDTATGMSIEDYPQSSTWYYVEATDNLGCKGVDSVYVVVGPVPYDAISPNGDGKNDEWEILDIASYPTADIQIFNRWGSLIFSSTGDNYNNNKWNGEHEGKLLPVGTYYYTINLKDGSELQTGAVTIVR
jgi:large repetitive protein